MANEVRGLVNITTGAEVGDADARYSRQGTSGAPIAETLYGVKTFNVFPVGPSSAPSSNYEFANKLYVDNSIGAANAMVYKGVIDCALNPNYPAGSVGWTWIISVAGKIGGASGTPVEVGDMVLCNTAYAGGTDGTKFNIIEHNVDGAVTGPASAVSGNIATFSGSTGKLIADSGVAISAFVTKDQTTGQTIGDTTNRLTKLWATDITCTNAIAASITGSAASATNLAGDGSATHYGALFYQTGVNTTSILEPNKTTTRKFLRETGDGTNGTAPAWDTLTLADVPTYIATISSLPTPTTAGVAGQVGLYLGYKYTWLAAAAASVSTGNFVIGKAYTITFVGDTDFTLIGASSNTLGVCFTATGVGGGTTGTAASNNVVREVVETIW